MTLERQDGRHSSQEQPASSQALYADAYQDRREADQHGNRAMQEIGAMLNSAYTSSVRQNQAEWAATGEAFDAMGRAINRMGQQFNQSMSDYGTQLAKENQDVVRAGHEAAVALDRTYEGTVRGMTDMSERYNNHRMERPATAQAEQILPGVYLFDSQMRGHTNAELAAMDRAEHQRQAAAHPQEATDQERETAQVNVQAGDSYWRIAERHLQSSGNGHVTAAQIHALSAQLSERNQHRALQPGMTIQLQA